jgi:hypothetical protein
MRRAFEQPVQLMPGPGLSEQPAQAGSAFTSASAAIPQSTVECRAAADNGGRHIAIMRLRLRTFENSHHANVVHAAPAGRAAPSAGTIGQKKAPAKGDGASFSSLAIPQLHWKNRK